MSRSFYLKTQAAIVGEGHRVQGVQTHLWAGLGPPDLICAPGCHDVAADSFQGLCLLIWTHATVVQAVNFIADLSILLQQRASQSLGYTRVLITEPQVWLLSLTLCGVVAVIAAECKIHTMFGQNLLQESW